MHGAATAYTRHLEKMLDLMEAGQRTNERLMVELDNTRNNRTVRADSAVSKLNLKNTAELKTETSILG